MKWLVSLACVSLALGCHDAQTAVIVEVRSDVEVTRVDVEIRDADDLRSVDQFGFDASEDPKYGVPFSFRVVPGREGATEFVLRARGFRGDELVSEAKRRMAFVQRATRREIVTLTAACRDGRCDVQCDPASEPCEGTPVGGGAGSPAAEDGGRDASAPETNDGGAGSRAGRGASGAGAGGADAGAGGAGAGGAGANSAGASGAGGSGATASSVGTSSAGASGAGASGSAGDAAGAGGSAGSSAAGRGAVLSGKDYTADVTYLGQAYFVRNGIDGSGFEQSIRYQNTSITVLSVSGSSQDGTTSWPAVIYGHLYGKASMNTVLPLRIDQIQGIDVSFKSNTGSVPGSYYLITALWFGLNTSKVDNSLPTAGQIEIWHNANGSLVPDGTRVATGITVQGISGTYDFYEEDCFWDGQTCVTYVRNQPVTDFAGDLRLFVNDAMKRAPTVQSNWNLNAVITGFAIEQDGDGLQLNEVTASVR